MRATYFLELMFLTFLPIFGLLGLIAVVSPRLFKTIAGKCGHWVESGNFLKLLDKQFDLDQRILPHSRLLGVAVIAAVSVMATLYFSRCLAVGCS